MILSFVLPDTDLKCVIMNFSNAEWQNVRNINVKLPESMRAREYTSISSI